MDIASIEMNKILTIDFDIIMSPSINLYNDLINDRRTIDAIVKEYPALEYCLKADLYIYEFLTRIIGKVLDKVDKNCVYFISEHHKAVKLIPEGKVILYNVDHHHDLSYDEISNLKSKPNCGNWIKYLWEQRKIKEYHWIHNVNSELPYRQKDKKIITKDYKINDINFELFAEVNKVILCNSPQWIPVEYQSLFYLWRDMAELLKGRRYQIDSYN